MNSNLKEVTSTLERLVILLLRPLRKKVVLFVILAISILYCIFSVAHFHFQNRHFPNSQRPRFVKQNYGYEYDVDTNPDVDASKLLISSSSSSSSLPPLSAQSSQQLKVQPQQQPNQHHQEFAFLKRQHNLKESLGDRNNHDHHLPKDDHHHGFGDRGIPEDATVSSTLDTLGGSGGASGGIKCRNSVQGKLLIADDRGYVCPRKVVGINGCCSNTSSDSGTSTTTLYSCETCHHVTGCCAAYEYCISCCMSPQNRELLNKMVSEKKSPVFKIFISSITDYFELCLTKCRTSSSSVQHENTYRNPAAKHCYSDNHGVVAVAEDGSDTK